MKPVGLAAPAAAILALAAPAVLAAQEPVPAPGAAAQPPSAGIPLEPAANTPPVAVFTASSESLPAGGLVTFDARGSRDEDGTIVRHS